MDKLDAVRGHGALEEVAVEAGDTGQYPTNDPLLMDQGEQNLAVGNAQAPVGQSGDNPSFAMAKKRDADDEEEEGQEDDASETREGGEQASQDGQSQSSDQPVDPQAENAESGGSQVESGSTGAASGGLGGPVLIGGGIAGLGLLSIVLSNGGDEDSVAPPPPPPPPPNRAPAATADTVAAAEDAATVTGTVAGNDSDADGDTLSYTLDAAVAGLTLNADGSYSFDPSDAAYQDLGAGETRDVVASYTVSDGNGGTASSTLTITVTGANDAPTAVADTSAAAEDAAAVTGTVAGNDSDVDGDTLSYTLDAAVAGLTLNADGSYSFDPSDAAYQDLGVGETRDVVASYTVSDGNGGTATSTLTITVTGTNDAPTAVADTAAATEDAAAVTGTVATNDSDPDGDTLSYTLDAAVAGLTLNSDGSYSFDPSDAAYQDLGAGETRDVVASYTVSDGNGGTASSTLTITVTGTNDAPTAVADTSAATEDAAAVTGTVAGNDSDADGDTLSYALDAAVAGLTLNADGSYSFDPSDAAYQDLGAGETRDVVASYTVSDGNGGTASSTLTITVTGANDAPTAVADTSAATEDAAAVTGTVAGNDSDTDGDTLSYTLNAAVAGLTFNADGSYSFDPSDAAYQDLAVGETRDVVASYTVSDGNGGTASSTLTITVTGTNDTPVAVADVAAATEDAAAVTGTVATNDSDAEGDTLAFALAAPVAGLMLNADGSYSFDPSDAAYQDLAVGETRDVVASYTVSDGNGGTATSTLTITVTGTNDAPIAVADTDAATEDAAAVTGTVAGNDSDVDGDTLSYTLNAAVAGLTLNADGSYSFDPSDAAYQDLAAGETRDVVAGYTVSDGNGGTASSTLTITVTGTNDAPTAGADSYTVAEDAALTIAAAAGVLTNDGDTDGDALSALLVAGPANGTLTLNADGSFVYTPNADYIGPDSFTYRANDGTADSAPVTVDITVTPSNDAPTAAADTDAATEDAAAVTGTVAGNDSDADGDTLSYTLDAAVAGLTLNADGSYSFDPSDAAYQDLAVGETRDVVASYTVSDGNSGAATSTLTITVTGTNDAPAAAADLYAVTEDDTLTIAAAAGVLANDSDPDGDALSALLVTGPANGTLTLSPDGSFVYTPDANYTGPDSFTYRANDGTTDSAAVTVDITVTPSNDAPTAAADTATATEDAAAVTGTVAGNDSDADGDTLSYTLDAAVAGLTLNADGSYSFDPSDAAYQDLGVGETRDVVASYTVSDGNGGTATSTLTVTVTGTNDAPVAVADVAAATEDAAAVTGTVASNDSDVDGDMLTFALAAPVAGLTFNADGSYSFDPSDAAYQDLGAGETRDVVASYTVSDGNGGTATSTLTITVTGTNDTPGAVGDVAAATEDAAAVTGTVATNDSDPDGDTLNYALDAAVAGLTLNSDGSYSFDPSDAAYQDLAAGETRDVVASYTVSDGNGGTATSTLTITVTGTNDAPIAVADTDAATEDAAAVTGTVAGNDSDVDGDTLAFALAAPVAALTLNADGSYSFDPSDAAYQDLAVGETRDVVASYTVSDGNGGTASSTLTITVTGTNDAPTAVADTAAATEDAAAVTGTVAGNDSDADGDTLSYTLNAAVAGLTFNADGSYSFDPSDAAYQDLAAGETRDVVASYTVSDGNGGTANSTLTITVTGTNDAPTAVADSYTVDEDNTLTIAAAAGVLVNDGDTDGDALSALLVAGPANGTLTLNADGSFVYTPDANYSGTDSFTYRANDGTGSGTPVTVNLTVNSVNDAPVANNDSGTASEDSALTVSAATGLLANDTDIDGGALTVGSVNGSAADVGSQVTLASGALLTVNADGSYTYDPNGQFEALRPGQTGTDSFSYTVSDGDLTDTATATITIEGANEAPVAGDDAFTMTGNTPITFTAAQLLGNDSDPDGLASSLSITGVSAGTNGSVVDNGDGTYTFTPTTGYQGAASFSYTVMDADGSTDTGTVDLTVSGQVWYVNSGYDGSNGASDGSYLRPYTQLTQLNGGNGDGSTNDDVDGAGDTIFIADGGGTYTSGITLEEGQTLYGDGQAFTVNGIDIGQSASNSTINASSGVVVTLASDNTISGVNLVGSGTATGLSGTNFGTLTIGNSSIDTVDQAISLTTGTVAGTGLTSTNSDGGGSNISLSGVAGNLDLGTGTLANATVGANLNVSGGTVNVTYDGAITQAQAGSTVLVIGGHSGTLDLNGNITATNGAGLQFNNADGTYNINGSANTLNGGNAGVDILNGSNGTFNFANMTLTHNAAGDAFVVNGTSAIPTNANITFNGSITDNDGNAVVINEHDAGTITFQNGSISSSGVNASGIDVTNSSGGTINFNGPTTLNTGANAAVTLTNNTGATVNFASTGTGLDITTTTGAGFTATGGGTVTLTGAGNTVQTASGRAVEIDNVTIGGTGVTFQSVGVTDGTASTGIVLRNAGSGGFTITGTGSTAGSGGTINSIDSGTDGSATQGSGIYLDNTGNVSLSNMAFTGNFANFGIRGVNVNNFTLRDSTMNGADADDGGFGNSNAADEGAISFDNLTGTALFEGNNLSDGHEDNIRVVNNSGTLNMTVRDSVNNVAVIGRNGTTSGNDGILVTGSGSSDITLLIDGVDFAGSRGDIVQVDASNTATQNVTIRNSTMHNLHPDIVSGGGGISLGLSAGTGAGPNVTYNIENNSIRGAEGNAILVSAIGPAGHMSGTILGNTIGNNDGVHSASQADTGSSAGGNGILARVEKGSGGGTLSHSVRIENNNIGDIASGAGVYLVSNGAGDSSGTARLEAAIRGNTIDELGEFALGGIYAQTGGTGTDDGLLGVDIEDNTINLTGATGALAGIAFDDISPDAQFYFPGYGGPYDDAALEAFHTGPEGNIIDVTGTFAVPVTGLQTGTFANGSAFVLPAPLMVAAGQTPAGLGVTAAQADIDAVREAAIQRWIAAGATEEQIAAMQAVAITVADLPGGYLGQWTAEGIRIDSDGAGFGWYVDPTPEGDGEFAIAEGRLVATADGGAAGKLDLLTVLTHELGHVAGLDDVYDPGSEGELMFGFLAPGSRYLPDAQEASDPQFALSGQDNVPVADITPLIAQLFDDGFSHFREIDGVSPIMPEGGLPGRLDRVGLNMDDLLASVAGSTPPANENSPSEESLPAGAYDWASPSYMPVQDLMENSFADARVL